MDTAKQVGTIEGRNDITGGRSSKDKTSLANAAAGKSFSSMCFTSDGRGILAGGNSKYVCLYDIQSKTLLKRFQMSTNKSLDRMSETLNSKNMTEAGPIDLIDRDAENSDLEDRIDRSLPGVQTGDQSLRKYKPEVRVTSVRFSPGSRKWATATTLGVIVYSLDDSISFDPFDLDLNITPDSIMGYLSNKEYTKSLVAAFRLGEVTIMDRVYNSIPHDSIPLIVRSLTSVYYEKLILLLIRQLSSTPRIEFHLTWTIEFLKQAKDLKKHQSLIVGLRRCISEIDSLIRM